MGHPLILQALPADGRLYARLATDKKNGILFAKLFNCGGGPYTWSAIRNDLGLEDFAKDQSVFASRAEVEQVMDELLELLEDARATHPGLDRRRAFLDKTQWDIAEWLTGELVRLGRGSAEAFVRAILFGSDLLTPPGVKGPLGDGLRVVLPNTVRDAARVLGGIDPDAVCGTEIQDDLVVEDFRAVQSLYAEAAAHGEAIVVGD